MEDKISVIIPVYKVEPYLRQCLDSVINQTYKNLEILLIDDGSPDNCGTICDEYAANDGRIKVVHKKNAGVHAAWNDGLTMATGDWIAFVDSDDWLDVNYFEALKNVPQAESYDVIQSGGYYWEESRGQSNRWAFLTPFSYKNNREEKEDLKIKLLMRPNDPKTKGAIGYVWGKIYRNSLLKAINIRFDSQIRTGLMGDVLFNWDVFERASAVAGVVYCGYHYRITQGSGTFKFDPDRSKEQQYIQHQFYKRINKTDTDEKSGLFKAFETRCLRDIVHNLQRCYFHPDNPASHKEVAAGIKEMKEMPYYKAAIHSRNNPYNNMKLRAFQIALRLPWIWPLRVMIALWNTLDKREKKTT